MKLKPLAYLFKSKKEEKAGCPKHKNGSHQYRKLKGRNFVGGIIPNVWMCPCGKELTK